MASIIGSVLSSVVPSVLGSILEKGVKTLGNVAERKIKDLGRPQGNIGQSKIKQIQQQIDKNTNDIKVIKQQMEIEQ